MDLCYLKMHLWVEMNLMKLKIPCLMASMIWSVSLTYADDTSVRVQVSPDFRSGLEIHVVGLHEQAPTLSLPARVSLNERKVTRVAPSVPGRVMAIHVHLGDEIRQGETLATLSSTELGIAQAAYLKARTQVNLRRLTAERSRRLLQEGILSVAEARLRESELTESEVELSASAGQLAVMGMTADEIRLLHHNEQINSLIHLQAPSPGTLIARNISQGQIANPTDNLFTIADLSGLWLVAEVPEQAAYQVAEGHEAEARIPALQDAMIKGKIIYVADVVDPEKRTVTVRMEIANKDRLLKPEMLATLIVSPPDERVLSIPAQAVVSEEGRDHVFVLQAESGDYEYRTVELGSDQGGWRKVISGLEPGEKVVSRGGFLLNTERLKKKFGQ